MARRTVLYDGRDQQVAAEDRGSSEAHSSEVSSSEAISSEANRVTSLMPRKVVVGLGLGALLIFLAVWLAFLFTDKVNISNPTDKGVFSIGLAILLSIFLFVIYPQNISLDRRLGFPVVGLGGPAVLMIAFVVFFNRTIPDPEEKEREVKELKEKVYLFNEQGGEYDQDFSVSDAEGKEWLKISPIPKEAFKNVSRQAEQAVQERRIYFKSATGAYLGYIDSAAVESLKPEDRLRLGIYFASCPPGSADECDEGRDDKKAHSHLVSALTGSVDNFPKKERLAAVKALYRLMADWSNECSHYEILVKQTKGNYPLEPRLHMLAGIYLNLSNNDAVLKEEDEINEAQKAALAYYLHFVAKRQVYGRESVERILELLNELEGEVKKLAEQIRTALKNPEGPLIDRFPAYANKIPFVSPCSEQV